MRELEPIEAVIFNLDGPAAYIGPLCLRALDEILRGQNLPTVPPASLGSLAGESDVYSYLSSCVGRAFQKESLVQEWRANFEELVGSAFDFVPGFADLSTKLSGIMKLGVVSEMSSKTVRQLLGAQGLLPIFSAIAGRENYDKPRPSADAYQFVVKALGIPADQCVVVEDSFAGIKAAKRAGIDNVIALRHPCNSARDLSSAQLVISDLRKLQGILDPYLSQRHFQL